ncbi:MAG: c-type cytochrome [Candidatus Dadabacteria bacterium]|nr:c-type cytochrome [Candidatus Dadabacteria bacterium]NIQ14864.1 c-type cytochrome [Candidatus Dadabacteria bacterium]
MKLNKILLIAIGTFLSLSTFVFYAYSAGDAAKGKEKYDQLCATCHGATGIGDGVAAAALDPKPKNLCTTSKSDAEIKTIITKGGSAAGLSATMPAWEGVLSSSDIDNVIAHIKNTLCK